MNLKSIETYAAGAFVLIASATLSQAQVAKRAQSKPGSASHVAAELSDGRLNSSKSKSGDTVVVKLKDDVKANGTIVLKKGTAIAGVVRTVRRAEGTNAAKSEARQAQLAMMEVEWFAPPNSGKLSWDLSIALQYISHTNSVPERDREKTENAGRPAGPALVSSFSKRMSSQPNAALLSMPSVVILDAQTRSEIEDQLGSRSSGQLFKVGRGVLSVASGSRQTLDLYSRLDNDSLITSADEDFDIQPGAQLRLLVGVDKK